jgi:hypothetical protein
MFSSSSVGPVLYYRLEDVHVIPTVVGLHMYPSPRWVLAAQWHIKPKFKVAIVRPYLIYTCGLQIAQGNQIFKPADAY